jgi:pimeloyl-ACP methyl ester carboxylesterase
MPPPLHDEEGTPGEAKLHRVQDDENAAPTEYAVLLPPEYHPLRSYPAVVALHGGGGPQSAIAWWAAEAQRRGYLVIAPEYNLPGEPHDYRYSTSEHAAVELALRDARRRFAIDGDRVFVGGQLMGANMAWDFGLAHPDLFAGVVVLNGFPFKYVNRYLPHARRLPLYVVLGDLAPAANEVVFGQVLKPLIAQAWDVTYLEYFRRGLEDLPEEAPAVFDWMDRRRREPFPKEFEVVTARPCDNRFFGVVIQEFQPGRTTAPEAVDGFGKNLKPATIRMDSSRLSNNLRLQTNGVKRLDVWVSPRLLDFKKRMEVRINGRPYFRGVAKPELAPLLEDLRLRGDRQQVYWLKVSAG